MITLVSQRVEFIENYSEYRDCIDQRLVMWLSENGFVPVPVPNILGEVQLKRWLENLSATAIVLSGGNDIGQYSSRDETESILLRWAEKNQIPVLGICRGMQFMVKWYGGKLVETDNHVGVRHRLKKIIDEEELPHEVNSYHNFGLRNCPEKFNILAMTDDGFIEAISHKSLPWEGWMWHPERELTFNDIDQKRLSNLFYKGQ